MRGEPGIGKTTLWRDALERFRAAGHAGRVARAAEEEPSLMLGGLTDLGLADEDASGRSVLAEGRAALAEIRRAAQHRPLVFAIDDLQWLDSASARTLRYAL